MLKCNTCSWKHHVEHSWQWPNVYYIHGPGCVQPYAPSELSHPCDAYGKASWSLTQTGLIRCVMIPNRSNGAYPAKYCWLGVEPDHIALVDCLQAIIHAFKDGHILTKVLASLGLQPGAASSTSTSKDNKCPRPACGLSGLRDKYKKSS